MKTIEIEGQKFEVPNWVNWIAHDENGSWRGFEEEPSIYCMEGRKRKAPTGQHLRICAGTYMRETMVKV